MNQVEGVRAEDERAEDERAAMRRTERAARKFGIDLSKPPD
jgi:hypothetical protein